MAGRRFNVSIVADLRHFIRLWAFCFGAINRGYEMRVYIAAALCMASLGLSTAAEAKGCIRGALVGGIAGHFAGHHGLLGAAAGCVAGRSLANRPKPMPKQAPPAAPDSTVQTQ